MIWRAHEADGRISAKNALKIRAALRTSARWERVFEAYKRTQPAVSKNPAQDRARARSWAMLSVAFDNDALIAALRRTWADGFALGIISADDAVRQAKELKKADDPDYVDWANWKPGDAAAALLIKPTRAFQRLLEAQGATIRGIDRTGYDRLGTALADAIALGLSGRRAAKLIQDSVSDPARALTIAITETNRAISRATIERYQNFGLEKMEWVTSDPCDKCVQNEGKTVQIGQTFPSGDTQPPVHPNCRCALLPVVPDFEAPVDGIEDVLAPQDFTYESHIPGVSVKQSELDAWLNESVDAKYDVYSGNQDLAAAYRVKGYNGLPTVLSDDEFKALADAGGTVTYRGISNAGRSIAGDWKTAEEFMFEYKHGAHYAGLGVHGNGTYSSTKISTALGYASGDPDHIMKMIIQDTSKFISLGNIKQARLAIMEKMVDKLESMPAGLEKDVLEVLQEKLVKSDNGTWATLLGYDGIEVDIGSFKDEESFFIILNRAKVGVLR